jgi:ABC-type lipoprotein export system ATPase subunit
MYCLSTLKKPTEGKIFYNGEDIVLTGDKKREELRRKEFGFVFQKHYLVPYLSALDNVTQQRVADCLKQLHCTRIAISQRPDTLRHCDRIITIP